MQNFLYNSSYKKEHGKKNVSISIQNWLNVLKSGHKFNIRASETPNKPFSLTLGKGKISKEEIPMDEFLWMVGLKLMEMRLAIEGALNLYAEIAGPLYRKEDAEAAAKLDTIENALHGIRDRIWELQIQYKQVSRK